MDFRLRSDASRSADIVQFAVHNACHCRRADRIPSGYVGNCPASGAGLTPDTPSKVE